ncbi:MAG: tyrosine-type recombinase/integrase, partial [Chloroflexi bacterium]|nr:tyrosine-type recombinase/integrase [Chloroflexota bacterium]
MISPVTEILNRFAAYLRQQDFSPNTVVRYQRVVSLFWRWFMEEHPSVQSPPDKILALPTDEDIRAFRDREQRKHRPAASINTYLMALRRFFAWAVAEGLRADDPTSTVKLLKAQQTMAPKALAASEEAAILEAARRQQAVWRARSHAPKGLVPSRDLCLLTLMSKSGLRVSEVVGILIGDLIYEPGEEAPVEIRIWGKGRKQRMVPLGRELRNVLAEYLKEIDASNLEPDAPLFPSHRTGKPITTSAAWRRVRRYTQMAGVKASPHVLRHTF